MQASASSSSSTSSVSSLFTAKKTKADFINKGTVVQTKEWADDVCVRFDDGEMLWMDLARANALTMQWGNAPRPRLGA